MSAVIRDKFYNSKFDHKCSNCNRTIWKGERYRRTYGFAWTREEKVDLKLCKYCTDETDDGHLVLMFNQD